MALAPVLLVEQPFPWKIASAPALKCLAVRRSWFIFNAPVSPPYRPPPRCCEQHTRAPRSAFRGSCLVLRLRGEYATFCAGRFSSVRRARGRRKPHPTTKEGLRAPLPEQKGEPIPSHADETREDGPPPRVLLPPSGESEGLSHVS